MPRRSAGTRSMRESVPSKYFRSETMTSSHKPRSFKSRTRYSFTTVNSPDKFDFTYRFWNVGSIQDDTPMMFEIVAVGAIATQFELRMPYVAIRERISVQSMDALSSTST